MCSFLPGAPAALWQRDVVHVQTGTHRYRHCHFAAAGLCVARKSLFFLKRKKFQISFRKVRTMHAKGIKNLMEKSSWKTLCGKGYYHSRGLGVGMALLRSGSA